ncbi:CRTAC1 family protein [Wenzhouxiangella marina]|uniref:CRTAC1 family protein n=1 Tax=Wenzhouxiangella marina TaxID=1579979 RepID=UPI00146FDA55|nr:CRTAC1 family protein [Wenzhouxiangella marina]MBB6086689.1 hypothetical protein [Wenzhouxiangella marina]
MAASLAAAVLCVLAGGCAREEPAGAALEELLPGDSGVIFEHRNGSDGTLSIVSIMGSGGALVDLDRDGDLDLFLRQGAVEDGAGDQLFRNLLRETGQLRFERAQTLPLGPSARHGMGVAVGDPNGDGWPDLFLTNAGEDVLLINEEGFLREVDGPWKEARWSTAASFFDADGDGDEDLFVARYVDYSDEAPVRCTTPDSRPDYCGPQSYPSAPDAFYENRNGTFLDRSVASGIGASRRAGLGAVVLDIDRDGRPDLLVANDADENQVWINQGGLRFVDEGVIRGLAVNADGKREASMGIAVADVVDEGEFRILMTHLESESNTLYVADRPGMFRDRTNGSGLAIPSLPYTGFGTAWLHLDEDSLLDLLVINGAVSIDRAQQTAGIDPPLREVSQAFLQQPSGGFIELEPQRAPALAQPMVGRGLIVGDLDDDGDLDAVVTRNNASPIVLVNRHHSTLPWFGLRLQRWTGRGWSEALGAELLLSFADGRQARHRYHVDGSYLASGDGRIRVRLGPQDRVESMAIRWPSGRTQTLAPPPTGAYTTIREPSP